MSRMSQFRRECRNSGGGSDAAGGMVWLGARDSNPARLIQSQPCCRYTSSQRWWTRPESNRLFPVGLPEGCSPAIAATAGCRLALVHAASRFSLRSASPVASRPWYRAARPPRAPCVFPPAQAVALADGFRFPTVPVGYGCSVVLNCCPHAAASQPREGLALVRPSSIELEPPDLQSGAQANYATDAWITLGAKKRSSVKL